MTLHENGKSVRCRVLATWQTANNKTAHQLQALDSGEMMTLEEDGPPTSVAGARPIKALPMRVFHWGRSMTPPKDARARRKSSPPPITSWSSRRTPASPAARSSAPGNEQIVWWEEKNGQKVSREVVTTGHNPFEVQGVVTAGNMGPTCPGTCCGDGVYTMQNGQPTMMNSKPNLGERLGNLFKGSPTMRKPVEGTVVGRQVGQGSHAVFDGPGSERQDPHERRSGREREGQGTHQGPKERLARFLGHDQGDEDSAPGKSVLEQTAKNDSGEKEIGRHSPRSGEVDTTSKKLNAKAPSSPDHDMQPANPCCKPTSRRRRVRASRSSPGSPS